MQSLEFDEPHPLFAGPFSHPERLGCGVSDSQPLHGAQHEPPTKPLHRARNSSLLPLGTSQLRNGRLALTQCGERERVQRMQERPQTVSIVDLESVEELFGLIRSIPPARLLRSQKCGA